MDQERTDNASGGDQGSPNKPTTAERARNVVQKIAERARAVAGEENVERAKAKAQSLGEQARAVISDENIERAKTMAREQGARAGEYVTHSVHENPYAALLIAGAIGYGLAYLIHSRSLPGQTDS